MANFLNIENLTKSYGDRLLFGDITFGVDEGDKIGIVARNGTGKSTLLRILAGQESADSGNVVFRNGIGTSMPAADNRGSMVLGGVCREGTAAYAGQRRKKCSGSGL